jgi:mRNA interferase MazF
MMSYSQGDIVLVWFPDSNLRTAKKRPGVVLQADNLDTGMDQVIIGMVTTNLRRKGHPSRILVEVDSIQGRKTGLVSDSVIMTDNVATVRTEEVYRKVGVLEDLERLKAALRYTFGV